MHVDLPFTDLRSMACFHRRERASYRSFRTRFWTQADSTQTMSRAFDDHITLTRWLLGLDSMSTHGSTSVRHEYSLNNLKAIELAVPSHSITIDVQNGQSPTRYCSTQAWTGAPPLPRSAIQSSWTSTNTASRLQVEFCPAHLLAQPMAP